MRTSEEFTNIKELVHHDEDFENMISTYNKYKRDKDLQFTKEDTELLYRLCSRLMREGHWCEYDNLLRDLTMRGRL